MAFKKVTASVDEFRQKADEKALLPRGFLYLKQSGQRDDLAMNSANTLEEHLHG